MSRSLTEKDDPVFGVQIAKQFILITIPVLALFLFLGVQLLPDPRGQDFLQFWAAGKMNWLNLSPYNPVEWQALRLQYGSGWMPNRIFTYPLPLYRLLAPLGLLPLQSAYLVWNSLTLMYLVLTPLVIAAIQRVSSKWNYVLFTLIGMAVFRPVLVSVRNGQITGLILMLCLLTVWLVERNKPFWGGIALGLCMIKPQIGFCLLIIFAFWILLNRKWRVLSGIISCELSLWLIGFLSDPGWVQAFLQESGNKIDLYSSQTPTIWGIVGLVVNQPGVHYTIALALSAALVLLTCWTIYRWNQNINVLEVMCLAVPVVLLITPYTWAYDQILLLIPWIVLSILFRERGLPFWVSSGLIPLGGLVSVVILLVSATLQQDVASLLLPVITYLGVYIFFCRYLILEMA